MWANLFLGRPPLHVRCAQSLPPPQIVTVLLQSPIMILGRHQFILLHCWNNQLDLAQDHPSLCGEENAPNMVLHAVQMEQFPIMMWHD